MLKIDTAFKYLPLVYLGWKIIWEQLGSVNTYWRLDNDIGVNSLGCSYPAVVTQEVVSEMRAEVTHCLQFKVSIIQRGKVNVSVCTYVCREKEKDKKKKKKTEKGDRIWGKVLITEC